MHYLQYESVRVDFTGEETWLVSKGYPLQADAKEAAEKILPKGSMLGQKYTWWDYFIHNGVVVMPGNRRLRFVPTAKLPEDKSPKIPMSRYTNYKLNETGPIDMLDLEPIEPPF